MLPSLVLNYFGQGALLLAHPEAITIRSSAWPRTGPRLPLLALAIAGGDHRQPGGDPGRLFDDPPGDPTRLPAAHGDPPHLGEGDRQIYVPFVNWVLMLAVVALVLGFETSSNLASAYGVAVTGTMLISSPCWPW